LRPPGRETGGFRSGSVHGGGRIIHLTEPKELSMNSLFSAKPLIAAALAIGGLAAGTAAQARTDVSLSIGIPLGGYVQPAPVYVQPRPVYVQPAPVYVAPAPVYYNGYYSNGYYYPRGYVQRSGYNGAWGDRDRDGVPNVYDRDSRYYDGQAARRAGWGDADRDGVPNRWDHAPHNPNRR
jgi:hypothetical protein